ncbi:MAG: hypothetical protein ACRDO2_05525, partial [Nocardioidaceae bacterium]
MIDLFQSDAEVRQLKPQVTEAARRWAHANRFRGHGGNLAARSDGQRAVTGYFGKPPRSSSSSALRPVMSDTAAASVPL